MLPIEQLIKISIGITVIIAVVVGLFLFGKYVTDFFENFTGGSKDKQGIFVLPKEDSEGSQTGENTEIENSGR